MAPHELTSVLSCGPCKAREAARAAALCAVKVPRVAFEPVWEGAQNPKPQD